MSSRQRSLVHPEHLKNMTRLFVNLDVAFPCRSKSAIATVLPSCRWSTREHGSSVAWAASMIRSASIELMSSLVAVVVVKVVFLVTFGPVCGVCRVLVISLV